MKDRKSANDPLCSYDEALSKIPQELVSESFQADKNIYVQQGWHIPDLSGQ